MEIAVHASLVEIRGNILTVADFETIRSKIEEIKSHKAIVLRVYDSLVINSSLIGYLVKLINQDGVTITIEAGNDTLIELLQDIGLEQTFELRKIA